MPLRPLAIGFVLICLAIVVLSLVGAIRSLRSRKWFALLLLVPALLCGFLASFPAGYLLGFDSPHAVFNAAAPVASDQIIDYLSSTSETAPPHPISLTINGVQASTGKTLWQRGILSSTSTEVVGAGVVISASRGTNVTQLTAFDNATGKTLWQSSMPLTLRGVGALQAAGMVVAGGFPDSGNQGTQKLVALRLSDGMQVWSATVGPYDRIATNLQIVSAPSASVFYDIVDNSMLEARRTNDGTLLGMIPRINGTALAGADAVYDVPNYGATGSLRAYILGSLTSPSPLPAWEFGTSDAFHAAIVAGDTLFVTDQHYGLAFNSSGQLTNPETLYALDARSGAVRWQFATQSAGAGTLATNADTVFINADDGITALRQGDGAVLWHRPENGWTFAAYQPTLGSVVYFTGSQSVPPENIVIIGPAQAQGFLYAVNASNGALYWGVPVGPVITTYPRFGFLGDFRMTISEIHWAA